MIWFYILFRMTCEQYFSFLREVSFGFHKMNAKNKIKLSSKLQQALTYMTKHWEELMAYTKIGSVLIDNNCCERAVRPFTNLRKNFGGFSSEQGARVTATYLTFVETCKLMAKAPLDFFRGFFDMIVAGRRDYALMTEGNYSAVGA